jgi:hypothetical protein
MGMMRLARLGFARAQTTIDLGEPMNRMINTAAVLLLLASGCAESSNACNPVAQTGCEEGLVCEEVVGGEPGCFAPVVLRGNVFDRANDNGIEDATVVALDANRSPASTVATTGPTGDYEIRVARQRDVDGNPSGGDVTLRADAAGFQTFPGGIRQALPIDVSDPVDEDGMIFGNVEVPNDRTGVLVVAETSGTSAQGFTAIADRDGVYRIFNLPDGAFSVLGYAQGANYGAKDASVSGGQQTQVDLSLTSDAPGTVTGSVQIVNPGAGKETSYILVVESTFDETLVRGETPPGLRAPEGTDLLSSGSWVIEGVPAGKYKVLGAFENDQLVRDPDLGQGNTDIVRVEVTAGQSVEAPSFKITGSLDVIKPGAEGPEEVTGTPVFSWVDDSSEARYDIDVFDTFGDIIWSHSVPGDSGSDPEVTYEGPALESGMFYQFRVTSFDGNGRSLSMTEDLKGVFFVP